MENRTIDINHSLFYFAGKRNKPPSKWVINEPKTEFCNEEHMIDGAPAMTTDSLCTCMLGGVINIVDNSVSMGGIGAQSVKSGYVHNGEDASSDSKDSTEIVDNDGKVLDTIDSENDLPLEDVESLLDVSGKFVDETMEKET